MTDKNDLADRLRVLDPEAEKAGKSRRSPAIIALVTTVAVIPAIGVFYLLSKPDPDAPLRTQTTGEFQTTGSAWGDLDAPRRGAPRSPEPEPEPEPEKPATAEVISPDMTELHERLAAMQEEISALRSQEKNGDDAATERLQSQIDALQQTAEEAQKRADDAARDKERELAERDRQIAKLQGELQLAQLGAGGGQFGTDVDPERMAFETRRAQAQEDQASRRNSPMIAIGGGGGASGSSEEAAQEEARLDPNEEFVRNAGKPAPVERAQIIVNPSNTITQGTVIQASLETALDSTLPGPLRAVTTQDVHSYDGTRTLIPRGSTLIGKYSAGVDLGQNRVMVAWERIILPDNQTVSLSAYGMDEIGRSGVTGKVQSHFGKRFGSAALISLISAVPTIAASQSDNRTVSDTVERVGTDLSGATGAIMSDYLRMAPTISVNQGARITVMVDRDLEIF